MNCRAFARRVVPARVRLSRALAARAIHDRWSGIAFARRFAPSTAFSAEWSTYSRPIIDYPGQELVGRAKRHNQRLLAGELDGLLIHPGEVLSVWRVAQRPSLRHGYLPAAALKEGILTLEPGGAVCLLSTVLYNAGLLAGLEVVERRCHSADSYGSQRYFELGRDAAIEYGYLDLRLRNRWSVALRLSVIVTETAVVASLRGPEPRTFEVALRVSEPEWLADDPTGTARFRVHTNRTLRCGSAGRTESLGWSVYRAPWAFEASLSGLVAVEGGDVSLFRENDDDVAIFEDEIRARSNLEGSFTSADAQQRGVSPLPDELLRGAAGQPVD